MRKAASWQVDEDLATADGVDDVLLGNARAAVRDEQSEDRPCQGERLEERTRVRAERPARAFEAAQGHRREPRGRQSVQHAQIVVAGDGLGAPLREQRHAGVRMWPVADEVTRHDQPLDACGLGVAEHRVECGPVGMDVGQHGDAHGQARAAACGTAGGTPRRRDRTCWRAMGHSRPRRNGHGSFGTEPPNASHSRSQRR